MMSSMDSLYRRVFAAGLAASSVHCNRPDFHFCRLFQGDALSAALIRHEHYLYSKLRLKPSLRVLYIGSGRGTAVFELVRFANVHVVGVDTDASKVQHARSQAQHLNFGDRVTFIHVSDLSNLSATLRGMTFDAICAIESLKGASSFSDVLRELESLLVTGGKLAFFEWCWSSCFDQRNIDHCRLASLLEFATAISPREPEGRTVDTAIRALSDNDFRLLTYEDLSERRDRVPWYQHMEKALSDPHALWSSDGFDEGYVFGGISRAAAEVIVEAGKRKLFTPMALFVAEKIH